MKSGGKDPCIGVFLLFVGLLGGDGGRRGMSKGYISHLGYCTYQNGKRRSERERETAAFSGPENFVCRTSNKHDPKLVTVVSCCY